MKKLQIIIFFLFLIITSCKENVFPLTDYDTEMEMEKVSNEMNLFDEILIRLYSESEKKPEKVIHKADSLLVLNRNVKDVYKMQIKSDVENSLHYLKAELYYKIGKYQNSIKELNFENNRNGDMAIAYAANYLKLKEFIKAKSFIDSIGNWNGDEYALGNYYESIGNKSDALKVYKNIIEQDKSRKHFAYYKWTVKRYDELQKNSPLLNEIFFPTGNPNFEVCDSDSENRTKIFDLMENIPENRKNRKSIGIVESPQENEKNYYWIKVVTEDTEINYYVYLNTFEIKHYNPKTEKLMSLEQWRKEKKNGL